MAPTQWQRIQASCKIIWGVDLTFDIEVEDCDDDDHYLIFVREDRGTKFGPAVTALGPIKGYSHAWNKLEELVARMEQAVETKRRTSQGAAV